MILESVFWVEGDESESAAAGLEKEWGWIISQSRAPRCASGPNCPLERPPSFPQPTAFPSPPSLPLPPSPALFSMLREGWPGLVGGVWRGRPLQAARGTRPKCGAFDTTTPENGFDPPLSGTLGTSWCRCLAFFQQKAED